MKTFASLAAILLFASLTTGCEWLLYESPNSNPTPSQLPASSADAVSDGLNFDDLSGFTSADL